MLGLELVFKLGLVLELGLKLGLELGLATYYYYYFHGLCHHRGPVRGVSSLIGCC